MITEIRKKLSTKQLAALKDVNTRLQETQTAFEDAKKFAQSVSTLILDALGIPDGIKPTLDDSTNELVYTEGAPEPDAAVPSDSTEVKASS